MAGTAAKGLVQHGFVLRQGGGPDGLPHIPLLREENFGVEQEGLEALRAFFWNGDSSSSLQNRQRPIWNERAASGRVRMIRPMQ